MILVDTSVWVDHFRVAEPTLARLLEAARVLGHAWVIGELALGQLARRQEILGLLQRLPQPPLATPVELLGFIDRERLFGLGIGYVDAQLLASARLMPGTLLWTRDKRLSAAAATLGLSADPEIS